MKILVVTAMYPPTAESFYGIVVSREVAELRAAGADVTVIEKGPGWTGYARQWAAAVVAIRSERPDVVHAHFGTSGLVAALLPTRRPLIVTLHGSDIMYGPKLTRSKHWLQHWMSVLSAVRASAVVVQARFMGELLPRRLRGRVTVLPQAIDLAIFQPGPGQRRDGVVFLGDKRRPVKRFELAQHAVSRLTPRPTLRSLDEVPPPDVPALLRGSALGLLTSRSEGLPVACREALASGLPIVAVDLPGTRELQQLYPDAVSLCAPDPVAVAAKLSELLRSEPVGEPSREAWHRRAEDLRWGPDDHARELLDTYRRVLGSPNPRRRP